MNDLRPTLLENIIGQKKIIECLKISIDAALKEKRALPHILLDGPPGIGKTSIALAISNEIKRPIQIANGATCRSLKGILPYITKTSFGSILFVDEIHRLTAIVEETLYPVVEDFNLYLKGSEVETNIKLESFTLIGATTDAGKISPPLYDRFVVKHTLNTYSNEEITELLSINADKLNIHMENNTIFEIAKRSKGIPRVANNLLLWVKDYVLSKALSVSVNTIQEAMKLIGVDDKGLTKQDRMYLNVLKQFKGPIGLNTLSSLTNIDEETISNQIEPYLLRCKIIMKTGKGRVMC